MNMYRADSKEWPMAAMKTHCPEISCYSKHTVWRLYLLSLCLHHHVFAETVLSTHCPQPVMEQSKCQLRCVLLKHGVLLMGNFGSEIHHQPDRKLPCAVSFPIFFSPQTPSQTSGLYRGLKFLPTYSWSSALSFVFSQHIVHVSPTHL